MYATNPKCVQDHFDREKRQLTELAATLKQRSDDVAATYSLAATKSDQSARDARKAEALALQVGNEKAQILELQRQMDLREQELFEQRLASFALASLAVLPSVFIIIVVLCLFSFAVSCEAVRPFQ